MRGEEIVHELLKDQEESRRGDLANSLLKEVFNGYPASNLIGLLSSEVTSVVKSGVYVASELASGAPELIDYVAPLLEHDEPSIRFDAIDYIHANAGISVASYVAKVVALVNDPVLAIRRRVLMMLVQTSASVLEASAPLVAGEELRDLTCWLAVVDSGNVGSDAIVSRLTSSSRLEVVFGIAAAGRAFPNDGGAYQFAIDMHDTEFANFIEKEIPSIHALNRRLQY